MQHPQISNSTIAFWFDSATCSMFICIGCERTFSTAAPINKLGCKNPKKTDTDRKRTKKKSKQQQQENPSHTKIRILSEQGLFA